jgi:hypothetical protein
VAEDLITRGLKDLIGGAATAGGVGQLLGMMKGLDDKLGRLERMFNGSLGSWDRERVRAVQFQTYVRPEDYPDEIICHMQTGQVGTGAPAKIATLTPRGKMRVAHVEFALEYQAGAVPTAQVSTLGLVWHISGGIDFDICCLAVSGSQPFASIDLPIPYPSRSSLGGLLGTQNEPMTRKQIEIWLEGPVRTHRFSILYFDRVDP